MSILKIEKDIIVNNNNIKYDPMYGGIYKGAMDQVYIEWEIEKDIGLEGYNVYYSFFPLLRYKVNDKIITTNYVRFNLPIFPQNLIWYFWVSKIVNGKEIFINEEGQTVYKQQEKLFFEDKTNYITPNDAFPEIDQENIQQMMKSVLVRIKNDFTFILQNDGVECDIYMKRWGSDYPFGVPCKCGDTMDADADFRGRNRCSLCFGTGIIGGYYPPIRMILRFNEMPARKFEGVVYGLKVSQTYNAWSIPNPILRSEDLVVRRFDGARYIVDQVEIGNYFMTKIS